MALRDTGCKQHNSKVLKQTANNGGPIHTSPTHVPCWSPIHVPCRSHTYPAGPTPTDLASLCCCWWWWGGRYKKAVWSRMYLYLHISITPGASI